jgi:hypothetical protein
VERELARVTQHQDTFIASSWPALYAQHGQEVTYRPLGVAADDETVEALWQLGALVTGYQPEDIGQVAESFGVLRVRPASASSPSGSDLFIISGETWAVAQVVRRTPLVTFQLRRYDQAHVRGARRIER